MSRSDEALLEPQASNTMEAVELATATAPAREGSIWSAVREALAGSHRDYTEGPLGRAVLVLAIPMVLEMLMESIFVVADVFFVAKLGSDAVATVGLTESMLALVYAMAMGLSIGVTATVARRTGEHDRDGAARAAVQGLVLGGLVAAVIGVIGVITAPRLLALMGASPEVVATGSGFTRVMLGGSASILLLFLVNAVFRGAGDAAIAMRTLWLANGINIALAPCLIFGPGPFPEMGVTGAAVATTIGRGTGVIFGLSRLFSPGSRLAVSRRHLTVDPALMLRLLRLSGNGTLQVLIGTASWIGLVRIVASFGSEALAGYTIAIRIILFALLPAFGLGNAAATLVGQALGAHKPDRAERAVHMAGRYNTIFLGLVSLVFVLAAPAIVAPFTHDVAVRAFAIDGLRVLAAGFLLYAYGMVLSQSFNGAGDTWTPTMLNLVCFWLWEIPLAYALAIVFGMGPHGVFLAITIAFSTFTAFAAVMFRRGTWKTKVV
ncbi:MAG TPA: MATE family efflux transporter [Gemmatimonadales bacterium]